MSTRSYICIEQPNGTFKGIYCHSDGYLTYNGAMLVDHYSDRAKIEHLIEIGNLSCLCKNIDPNPNEPHSFDYSKRQTDVCVFYGRDRDEENQGAQDVVLSQLANDPWIEYIYVYRLDNKWYYFEDDAELIELVEDGLNREFKAMGVSRPKDIYGYYTKEDIEVIKKGQL